VTGFAEWCHGATLYSFVRRSVAYEGKWYFRGEHSFYKRVLGILYYLSVSIQDGAKRTHVFQIIVTLFIFNLKKIFNTKTTCNKYSFDYLHWSHNYGKLYRKDGVLLAAHTSGASPQSSASHLLTFLVAQLQFLREWKFSDRRLYEVFERRLLI